MTADLLWFNGQDADDLGFVLEDAPNLLGSGAVTPQVVGVPQGVGVLLSAVAPSIAPRTLRITGYCTGASISAARIVHDRVKAACGAGVVEIRSAWTL